MQDGGNCKLVYLAYIATIISLHNAERDTSIIHARFQNWKIEC